MKKWQQRFLQIHDKWSNITWKRLQNYNKPKRHETQLQNIHHYINLSTITSNSKSWWLPHYHLTSLERGKNKSLNCSNCVHFLFFYYSVRMEGRQSLLGGRPSIEFIRKLFICLFCLKMPGTWRKIISNYYLFFIPSVWILILKVVESSFWR